MMVESRLDEIVRCLQALEATTDGRQALESPHRCDYERGDLLGDPAGLVPSDARPPAGNE